MRTILRTARLALLLLVTVLSVALMAPSASAATATTTVTATESVNVRSGPSSSSPVIGSLYRGQTVTALSAAQGWTSIRYPGASKAYVSSAYLAAGPSLPPGTAVGTGVVKVTTEAVNLRKGPGMTYAEVTVLPKGTKITLTGKTARGYAEGTVGRATGWVAEPYLTSTASGLPAVVGTRVATVALDIRTSSGANAKTVTEVKKGTVLSVTGATANGRAQIIFAGAVRWVTARYLANPTTNQPAPPPLPKVTGTRYATTALDIRSNETSSYAVVTTVSSGTALSITGVVKNERMQVIFNATVRWVTAKYLSTNRPTSTGTGGSYAVEKGLKPNTIKVHRAILVSFPRITTFYGVRPDPLPDHPSGRALDVMIPSYTSASGKALGKQIATWARANAADLGINYVIWDQHIWNVTRDKEGWRYMASRGGDSANHKNHVHITVFAPGLPGI